MVAILSSVSLHQLMLSDKQPRYESCHSERLRTGKLPFYSVVKLCTGGGEDYYIQGRIAIEN